MTMVGDVHVTGVRGPLVIHTVSGDVDVATAKGPVKAESMNGDVRIRVEAFGDTGGVSARTINGSVTAELPAQLDAQVEANTVNGSITTDYPLTVNGQFTGRHVKGDARPRRARRPPRNRERLHQDEESSLATSSGKVRTSMGLDR